MNEISWQKLEELRWLEAFFGSLGQARELLQPENFSNDSDVLSLLTDCQSAVEKLTLEWHKLRSFVEIAQAKCHHDFIEFHGVGKSYAEVGNVSETVVVAKVCRHCKLFWDSADSEKS